MWKYVKNCIWGAEPSAEDKDPMLDDSSTSYLQTYLQGRYNTVTTTATSVSSSCCSRIKDGLAVGASVVGGVFNAIPYWKTAYAGGKNVMQGLGEFFGFSLSESAMTAFQWCFRLGDVFINFTLGAFAVYAGIMTLQNYYNRSEAEKALIYGQTKLSRANKAKMVPQFVADFYLSFAAAAAFFVMTIFKDTRISWWLYVVASLSMADNWFLNMVGMDAVWNYGYKFYSFIRLNSYKELAFDETKEATFEVKFALLKALNQAKQGLLYSPESCAGIVGDLRTNIPNINLLMRPKKAPNKNSLQALLSSLWWKFCVVATIILMIANWGFILLSKDSVNYIHSLGPFEFLRVVFRGSMFTGALVALPALSLDSAWNLLSKLWSGEKTTGRVCHTGLYWFFNTFLILASIWSGSAQAYVNKDYGIFLIVTGYICAVVINLYYSFELDGALLGLERFASSEQKTLVRSCDQLDVMIKVLDKMPLDVLRKELQNQNLDEKVCEVIGEALRKHNVTSDEARLVLTQDIAKNRYGFYFPQSQDVVVDTKRAAEYVL